MLVFFSILSCFSSESRRSCFALSLDFRCWYSVSRYCLVASARFLVVSLGPPLSADPAGGDRDSPAAPLVVAALEFPSRPSKAAGSAILIVLSLL